MGSTHKHLTSLNIPSVDFKTFRKYEYEMGTAIEEVAKESCERAKVEREMTIQNSDNIQQLL